MYFIARDTKYKHVHIPLIFEARLLASLALLSALSLAEVVLLPLGVDLPELKAKKCEICAQHIKHKLKNILYLFKLTQT